MDHLPISCSQLR